MGVLEELCEGLPNDLRFQTSKSKRYRSRQYFSNEELKQPSDKLPWTSVQRYSLTFIKEQLNKTISQQNVCIKHDENIIEKIEPLLKISWF